MNTEIPEWLAAEVAEYDLVMEPSPASVLDIGANVGAFALRCASLWPSAAIRCYEPVQENYQELLDRTRHYPKIAPHPYAVRSFNRWEQILIGDRPVTCGFYHLGRQTEKKEKVYCLDAAEIPPADLVKIDTEGCEVEIMSRLNLSKTRALVVEYHRAEDRLRLTTLLLEAGFAVLEEKAGNGTVGILKFSRPGMGVSLPKVVETNGQIKLPEDTTDWATKLKDRALFIGVCSHFSFNDFAFVQSMLNFHQHARVKWTVQWSCEPSVERSRNVLMANFLEAKEFTHLLFIDSDIAFVPHCIHRICSHDEDIVGGMYPLKNQSRQTQWCGNSMESLGRVTQGPNEAGLQEIGCVGTGFLCISRAAIEKIISADGDKISYIQDWPPYRKEHAFFRQEVREVGGKRRFMTEDWNFCFRWRELGGKVFTDTQVILRHAGRAVWPLDLQEGNPFAGKVPPSLSNSDPI